MATAADSFAQDDQSGPAPTRYLGRGLLLALIRLYRRRLSGRGPLARVRCSFEGSESCSRYAERVCASVASGLLGALWLTIRRLRRCRQASLHRAGPRLTWGPLFDGCAVGGRDAIGRLDRALTAAGERAPTRAAALRSALIVARYCGQRATVREGLRRLAGYQQQLGARAGHVLVRDGRRVGHWLRRRVVRHLVLWLSAALIAGAAAGLASGQLVAPLVAALPFCALALAAALRHGRQRRRHAAQALINQHFVWPGAA